MCRFQCWKSPNETVFDQYITLQHSKWWNERKYRLLFGSYEKFYNNYIIMPI